jgi:hypothetical protein
MAGSLADALKAVGDAANDMAQADKEYKDAEAEYKLVQGAFRKQPNDAPKDERDELRKVLLAKQSAYWAAAKKRRAAGKKLADALAALVRQVMRLIP